MPPSTRSQTVVKKLPAPIAKIVTAVTKKTQKAANAIQLLKNKRNGRPDKALPYLRLNPTGICQISTGRMHPRSQYEVWNYAYLFNKYIKNQRGQKVKIKSTSSRRRDQANFCATVRKVNQALFDELNRDLEKNHKLFSVVSHLPDECVQVRGFGNLHNQAASTGLDGMYQERGWAPITNQANSLVAKIGNQKSKDIEVKQVEVDGILPDCFIRIKQVDDVLKNQGISISYGDSDSSSDEESEFSSGENSDSPDDNVMSDSEDE